MIEINVYSNGFLIDGHAHLNICDQVSMLGWHLNNLFDDLNIRKEFYYSTIPNPNSLEGLSFGRCDWSPLVEIFMNNFYDTVKYWLEETYPKQIKVYDYRKENFGVGAHSKFFEPKKEYYEQVKNYRGE
jgi:hypothetical protein